jgi:alpha-L-rhamnosidase
MPPLRMADWKAKWIASPDASCRSPLLRKSFHLKTRPAAARASICGLGYYELWINGRRVGDHVLDPGQTDYEARALYVDYDVADRLAPGPNAIGVMLGSGFYNQDRVWGGMSYGLPRLIFQLNGGSGDGGSAGDKGDEPIVISDDTWLTTAGPILENNVYAGETYDARREVERWSEPACDESKWAPAVEVPSPTKSLEPQLIPPIRCVRTIEPVKLTKLPTGATIVDLGENFAGWCRLRTSAPAGTKIRLRSAEALARDGALDPASTGVFATRVEQVDTYVSKGGQQTWEPRFTYHGFRYVEVTGEPEVTNETLTGVAVHTDLERIGTFECSDPMLNRIYQTAIRTLLGNVHSIPTDCPAREKCGWLGDAQICAELTLLNFDAASFYDNYLRHIETSWRGELPGDVAPGKRCSDPNGHLDWGLAVVLLPWYVHLYTGDEAILRDHYASMTRFMDRAAKLAKDGIQSRGYGDWCPPGSVEPVLTPPALTTTAWFAHAAKLVSRTAHLLGHRDDAARFETQSRDYAAALNHAFFKPDAKTYGSQCADAMALQLDLCPPEHRAAVAANLNRDVIETHKVHHTTGIFGSRYLHAALADGGYLDSALALLRQTTYPSIGHLFSLGATTFWECWGEPEIDAKWGARSQNHPMQAAFVAWFHHGLGGIRPSPEEPGFRHVILRPHIPRNDATLTHVRATHRTPRGRIVSEWRVAGGKVSWHVELPPDTTATAYAPEPRAIGSGAHEFQW